MISYGISPTDSRAIRTNNCQRQVNGLTWLDQLAGGDVVVIDGGTGTELQKRGVPMNEIAWTGAAVLSHPQIVRDTHRAYLDAGAEVIIANTFGSTRQMLEPAGFGDQVKEVNRRAVSLALEARVESGRPAAIAGSLSAMPPGFDRDQYLSPRDELNCYREALEAQLEGGIELVALEMMEDIQHAARATQAAKETGLPIWLGISCKLHQGKLVGFADETIALEDILSALLPAAPAVVNIMHSNIDAIVPAVQLLRSRWDGPIGVYPESGYFTKPDWQFVDVIAPDDLADLAVQWVQLGVQLVGGCCGTGPEHIKALHRSRHRMQPAS